MWTIEVYFRGAWVALAGGFETQSAAEWAIAEWKQASDCRGDPFRAVPAIARGKSG